jgi:hypothetical protein
MFCIVFRNRLISLFRVETTARESRDRSSIAPSSAGRASEGERAFDTPDHVFPQETRLPANSSSVHRSSFGDVGSLTPPRGKSFGKAGKERDEDLEAFISHGRGRPSSSTFEKRRAKEASSASSNQARKKASTTVELSNVSASPGGMYYIGFFYLQRSLSELCINTITALDKYINRVTFLPTESWALDDGIRLQRPKQDNSVVTCSILAPL